MVGSDAEKSDDRGWIRYGGRARREGRITHWYGGFDAAGGNGGAELHWLKIIYGIAPAVVAMFAIAALVPYTLTEARHRELREYIDPGGKDSDAKAPDFNRLIANEDFTNLRRVFRRYLVRSLMAYLLPSIVLFFCPLPGPSTTKRIR